MAAGTTYRVTVHLDEQQLADLKHYCDKTGLSQSAALRFAFLRLLSEQENDKND